MSEISQSQQLANFCANLRFEQIPPEVVESVLNLMADWAGSCLAGSSSRQAAVFRSFSSEMGPASGPSQIIGTNETSSPLFAAMINAASSHVVEQDDLHNSSILHPAAVVFPPLLAAAQALPNVDGKAFITAAAAGYEAGIRIGEFLGLEHYRVFHMTGTAGTLAAAMAVANLLKLDEEATLNALGSAGTQAAGLWAFLGDAADSKQLHTAKAASDGLLAAWTAKEGLTGAKKILEGHQGMAAGMLASGPPEALSEGLGARWALAETSYKWHASCRHTHPAADALQQIMLQHQLDVDQIASVRVGVYQAAFDVLSAVERPRTIHQSKFSMGFVLALIAVEGLAGVQQFTEQALTEDALISLHDKVSMEVDEEINQRYPKQWCAKVSVKLLDGQILQAYVDSPRGDPENPLSREELSQKACALVEYYEICTKKRMKGILKAIWSLPERSSINGIFDHCEQ